MMNFFIGVGQEFQTGIVAMGKKIWILESPRQQQTHRIPFRLPGSIAFYEMSVASRFGYYKIIKGCPNETAFY